MLPCLLLQLLSSDRLSLSDTIVHLAPIYATWTRQKLCCVRRDDDALINISVKLTKKHLLLRNLFDFQGNIK